MKSDDLTPLVGLEDGGALMSKKFKRRRLMEPSERKESFMPNERMDMENLVFHERFVHADGTFDISQITL